MTVFFPQSCSWVRVVFIPYYDLFLCDIRVSDLCVKINEAHGDQSVKEDNAGNICRYPIWASVGERPPWGMNANPCRASYTNWPMWASRVHTSASYDIMMSQLSSSNNVHKTHFFFDGQDWGLPMMFHHSIYIFIVFSLLANYGLYEKTIVSNKCGDTPLLTKYSH